MYEDIKNLLIPYFIPDLKRYGGTSDGGYVLSEKLVIESQYVYSYGVGSIEESISFDRDMALLGKNVYMYDATIEPFWNPETKFFFKKENVNSENIYNHIKENNHEKEKNLILKMDIEGCEYETFLNTNQIIFNYFDQITLEVHGVISNFKVEAFKLFNLLNKNYYLVHIHGNNHDLNIEDGICNTLELSYIRKDCFNQKPNVLNESCPREGLDYKNYLYRNDIFMDWWLKNEI